MLKSLGKVIIPSKVCIRGWRIVTWEGQSKAFQVIYLLKWLNLVLLVMIPCLILKGYLHKTLCGFVLTMFCCCFIPLCYLSWRSCGSTFSPREFKRVDLVWRRGTCNHSGTIKRRKQFYVAWLQCRKSELILQKWSQSKHFKQLSITCGD